MPVRVAARDAHGTRLADSCRRAAAVWRWSDDLRLTGDKRDERELDAVMWLRDGGDPRAPRAADIDEVLNAEGHDGRLLAFLAWWGYEAIRTAALHARGLCHFLLQ